MRGALFKFYLINFFILIVYSSVSAQRYKTHEGEEWIIVDDAATLDSMRSKHFPDDGKYLQTQDIDLSDYSEGEGWRRIGTGTNRFSGVFDGQGYTISNLTINSNETYQGLFASIDSEGTLKRIRLTSVQITNNNSYTGALAGRNEGYIFDCAVLDGELSVNNYAGGLVGNNRTGTIVQCYSGVNISGGTHIGGLVGSNSHNGLIINSYSDNKIRGASIMGGLVGSNSNSSITNCYSSGQVSWSLSGGGLLGENTGNVKQSYWNIETSNQSDSSGEEEGKSDHDMKKTATFIDWDFDEVWEIRNDESMPYLRLLGERNIEIIKEIPELTFILNDRPIDSGSIINAIYGDVLSFDITSTSDGDLSDLIIESSNPNLLDLSDLSEIKVLKTGSTILKITQPETDHYESKEVYFDVVIAKKALLITPTTGQQKTYGEEDPEYLQFISIGLLDEDDQSVFYGELKRIEGENAGEYAIHLHSLTADHYTIHLDTNIVFFKIIPREIIISVDDQEKVYNDIDPELSFQVLSDGPRIPFEGSLKREEGENAGRYTISEGSLNAGSNYSLFFAEGGNFTIEKAESEIIADLIQVHTYDGTEKTVAASLNHEETELTFEPYPSFIDADTYQVKVSAPETTNYLQTESTVTLTINKAIQEGLPLADTSYIYNGELRHLTLSGVSPDIKHDLTILYENNGQVTAGIYKVTATVSRPNFEDLVLSAMLTIHKAAAEITAEPIQVHTYDGTEKTVAASLNHEETELAFEPYPSFIDADTYQVKVSAPETINYLQTESTVTLTINKAVQEGLSLTDTSYVYNGELRHLTLSGMSPDIEHNLTILYKNNGHVNAGIYKVTATVSRPNFEDLVMSAELTIHKAEAEIIAEPIQIHTYDGTAKTVAASLNHEETELAFEPYPSFIDADTYQVKVSAPETTNYLQTESTVTLTINKAIQQGLSLMDADYVYNGEIRHLTLSGVSPDIEHDLTILYKNNGHVNAGNYQVTATVSRPNFEDLSLSAELTIHKAESKITAEPIQIHTYDGTAKSIIAHLNHEETELAFEPYPSFINADTYQVKVSAPETTNYLQTESTVTLTINKAIQEGLSLVDTSYVYNGELRHLTLSGVSPESEHELEVLYKNNGHVNAGIYKVTATVSRPNFEDLVLSAELTIHKAESEIIADLIQIHTYDGTAKEVLASLNHEETELAFEPYPSFIDADTYQVKVSAPETTNYLQTESTVTLSINKAIQQGLSLMDADYVYNGEIRHLTLSGVSPDIEHDLTILYKNNGHVNAGNYQVTATVSRPNFEDLSLPAELTIHKAEAKITAEPIQTHTYDGTAKSIIAHLDHEETNLTFESFIKAGTYKIDVYSQETQNFLSRQMEITLIVEKATLTIIPNNATRQFGEPNPIFTMSYQGFKNNEDESVLIKAAVGNTGANLTSGTGEYLITPSGAIADNYSFEYIDGLLTITPANLEGITLENHTFTFNNQRYSLSVKNLSKNASVSYENNDHIHTGIYEVKATIHKHGFKSQTLKAFMTIKKAPQAIHFKEVGSVSRNAHRIELDVTSSMGLPVELSADDHLVASLDDNSLLIHRLGTVRITARQEGDANHEAAAPVTIQVRVEDEAEGPVRVHQAISPNGDGINDFLILEGIKEFPENRLKIISRVGHLVFDMDGYDNDTNVFRGISNTKYLQSTLPDGTYLYLLQYKNNKNWQSQKGWIVIKRE